MSTIVALSSWLFFFSTWIVIKPNRTPSGKKTVVQMQLVTASQVQDIRCRWQAILSYHNIYM